MLAKKTSKNQLTLPKAVVAQMPPGDYFEVSVEEGSIVLRPVVIERADERLASIRGKIRALGLKENEIAKAVRNARRK